MSDKILIVDDEVSSLKVLSTALKKETFRVDVAMTGEEAMSRVREDSYDLILLDYKLPDTDGELLLQKIKAREGTVPVVLLTAYGTIEMAVNTMKKGAYSFLTKPVNLDGLIAVVKEALRTRTAGTAGGVEGLNQFYNIIGKSKAIREVYSMIHRISKTDANVLITGESGTGKELVARAIHYHSLRADGPFIPLDCTTIPEELVESELFGYDKGAFTCAYETKKGLLEMADRGTIFLDEIGDLDFALQKKLLRFLQEREFFSLGGKRRIKVDTRVLAATNRDIETAVEKGEFRKDLYFRLNVITIHIPALRERKEDIPLLAAHFVENFSTKNKKQIQGFDDEVQQLLQQHDWPGNVRELENAVERAVIFCPFDRISTECVPHQLKMSAGEYFSEAEGFNLDKMERRVILRALEKTSWNQSGAAALLGITRKRLRTKMKNLGLLPGRDPGEHR